VIYKSVKILGNSTQLNEVTSSTCPGPRAGWHCDIFTVYTYLPNKFFLLGNVYLIKVERLKNDLNLLEIGSSLSPSYFLRNCLYCFSNKIPDDRSSICRSFSSSYKNTL
jgi:hypothetical protein